jgi:hypothetical protein
LNPPKACKNIPAIAKHSNAYTSTVAFIINTHSYINHLLQRAVALNFTATVTQDAIDPQQRQIHLLAVKRPAAVSSNHQLFKHTAGFAPLRVSRTFELYRVAEFGPGLSIQRQKIVFFGGVGVGTGLGWYSKVLARDLGLWAFYARKKI